MLMDDNNRTFIREFIHQKNINNLDIQILGVLYYKLNDLMKVIIYKIYNMFTMQYAKLGLQVNKIILYAFFKLLKQFM